MPELPEVETIRRDLGAVLKGQRMVRLHVRRPRLLRSPRSVFTRYLVGSRVTRVARRAKQLVLELSSGYALLIHLKMTGQLVWRSPKGALRVGGHPIVGVGGVPNRFTFITLTFQSGGALFFNDVRQFGYWRLVPKETLPRIFSTLGPEPLERAFTRSVLSAALKRHKGTSIKAALLNQSVVAGIGNIYADESLFVARLKPARRVGSLEPAEVARLYHSIRRVLTRAVKARGTSFNSYVDGLGRAGTYWDKRLVYGRAGLPCPRCSKLLKKTAVAGRGTTWCASCQR